MDAELGRLDPARDGDYRTTQPNGDRDQRPVRDRATARRAFSSLVVPSCVNDMRALDSAFGANPHSSFDVRSGTSVVTWNTEKALDRELPRGRSGCIVGVGE
jgi:hypothetical protein